MLSSSYRSSSALVSATPSATLPSTSFVGIETRLLWRKPTEIPSAGNASPMNSVSSPAMILSSELLPGAVQAEHADLCAGEKREPDVLENDGVGRMNLPEPLHRVDVLHRLVLDSETSEYNC